MTRRNFTERSAAELSSLVTAFMSSAAAAETACRGAAAFVDGGGNVTVLANSVAAKALREGAALEETPLHEANACRILRVAGVEPSPASRSAPTPASKSAPSQPQKRGPSALVAAAIADAHSAELGTLADVDETASAELAGYAAASQVQRDRERKSAELKRQTAERAARPLSALLEAANADAERAAEGRSSAPTRAGGSALLTAAMSDAERAGNTPDDAA